MEKNGGMVAVVQGLRDSSLTVTLLDGGKQYTLMPNDHVPQPHSVHLRRQPSVNCASQYTVENSSGSTAGQNRENGIQATDGRYASTYKMMHCNVTPTSPPQTVTEFPPQRPEVLHGHGNFVIGGCGSGETARPTVKTNSFRGGMVWPDKGSVCASRASTQSDAFANSLRKYPNITPERSSEIVERLISFTQAKNLSKLHNKCPYSPTRNSMDSESSKQTFILERNSSKNSIIGRAIYPPDVNVTSKKYRSHESSPVRERSNNYLLEENDDIWNRPMFCKSNDVRCFRDTARKVKQGFKNLVDPPINQFKKLSSTRIKEQYDCEVYQGRIYEQASNNSVNMEIQAAAQMESKEILTLPRIVPMQRTIATPLSPIPSKIEGRIEEGIKSKLSSSTDFIRACLCKSIQVKLPLDADIKITSNYFNLPKIKWRNKSKSEEMLGNIKNTSDSISTFVEFKNNCDVSKMFIKVKEPISKTKRICQNCKHLFDDFDVLRRSVSNNTYFREDFQFNINEQRTSKHCIEMSKHYHISGSGRVNNTRMAQRLPEFLSHIDISNNVISTPNADIKIVSSSKKPSNEAYKNLMNKVSRGKCHKEGESNLSKSDKGYSEDLGNNVSNNNKILPMTLEEIKNLIDLDILAFTEKYRINITTESLYDLIEELFDLFVLDLNNTSFPNKKNMTKKIKNVLQNRGLSEFQSIYLTNILTEHWEEEFLATKNLKLNSSNYKSETLIVLPNLTRNLSQYKLNENSTNYDPDFSINEISQKDIDSNVKVYVSQVSNEINEWFSNLQIPEVQDIDIRHAIINDLASDIVDRHKYLELNSASEISETSELEHLKYQIFKLIYKLGIDDMTLVDSAIDLMKRIQNITVPIFTIQKRQEKKLGTEQGSKSNVEFGQSFQRSKVVEPSNLGASSSRYLSLDTQCCNRPTCKRNVNNKTIPESNKGGDFSLKEPGRSYQATTSTRRMSSPRKLASTNTDYSVIRETSQFETNDTNMAFQQHQSPINNVPHGRSKFFSGAIKIRDDENDNIKNTCSVKIEPLDVSDNNKSYNQYLKEWVQKLPLLIKSADDEMSAEVARMEMFNGILEAVSKLKSDRETYNNRFLFEDKLDDEIEILMNKLPQTPELISKKQIFKIKLIEKTSNTNDVTKSSAKSYKEQLVETLKEHLPKTSINDSENPEILEIYEELQILNLVEDFIISSCYQNHDPIIAEAFKNKLVKRAENFVEELKRNHNKALKNIDEKLYLKDILDTLKNVPIPSNETVQEEADDILLSIEIDKWISDLPLIQNNDFIEQLHRRRLKNNLVKQILNLEKYTEKTPSILDNSLKHEISQFLGRAPLQNGESLNINSMVDELIKRLKNRPISIENDSKKVAFNEPDYEEFSKNMPLCSTYIENSGKNIAVENRCKPGTKSIQAIDQSQQLYGEHYHNISKPVFDDPRVDQNCCNTHLRHHGTPNYESFENTRPRSSTLKDDLEPHWYTLKESREGYHQSDNSLSNIRMENKTEQSHKSIQAISPKTQNHSRHYHNIAQPLLDDLRLDSDCCNNNIPRTSLLNGDPEPNWYTLQESKEEYSQSNKLKSNKENSRSIPYLVNASERPDYQHRSNQQQYDIPEQEFITPQQYLHNADPKGYPVHQEHDISYENQKNSPKRDVKTLIQNGSQEAQRWPNSQSPADISPRRRNSPRFNQKNTRIDQFTSPRRSYHPTYIKEPKGSNLSAEFQHVIEEQHSGNPQLKRPDLFYRLTDQDGIKQTIERNQSMEAEMDKCDSPEHLSGYYQPSVIIPPGYVPLRIGIKKGSEEDSEEENDEEDQIRCRCVEKLWRNKRRYRYCPFEQYEGFPMCLTSPYFYPYFY